MIDNEMHEQLNRPGGEPSMPQLKQVWFPGGHINIGGGNPGILYGVGFDFEREFSRAAIRSFNHERHSTLTDWPRTLPHLLHLDV